MLADLQALVDNLVRDEGGRISSEERDLAISLAVVRYSTDRPRIQGEDYAATGGRILALPAGFDADFSRIVSIESPPDLAPPALITGWTMGRGLSGERIELESSLNTGDAVRVFYTARHDLSADTDTIPLRDREAVANWAAALLLDELANASAGDRQGTIQADSVDHASRSKEYSYRAKSARQLYLDHLGIDTKRNAAAGTVVTLPSKDSLGGPRFYHGVDR